MADLQMLAAQRSRFFAGSVAGRAARSSRTPFPGLREKIFVIGAGLKRLNHSMNFLPYL
jgi:hypothetical protein